MLRLGLRNLFAIAVVVPPFVFLAWLFGIYFQPQGSAGMTLAWVMIGLSALAALWVHAWLAGPPRKVRFRDRGVDGGGQGASLGLLGAAEYQRRRRDDTDGEDPTRRRDDDAADEELDEGGFA
ncbi:hypothetical protein [Maricaulis sp. CAU 1757]